MQWAVFRLLFHMNTRCPPFFISAEVVRYRRMARLRQLMRNAGMPFLFLLLAAAVRGQSTLDACDPKAKGPKRPTASVQNRPGRMRVSSPEDHVTHVSDKSAVPTRSQHLDSGAPRLFAKLCFILP